MKKWFVLFMLISTNAFAGMGACHDGSGNITDLQLDADSVYFKTTPNCFYYELGKDGIDQVSWDRIRNVILNVPNKYIKLDLVTDEPVEMTAGEKTVVDSDSLAARDLSVRSGAKAILDGQNSDGLRIRCLVDAIRKRDNQIISRINDLIAGNTPSTLNQITLANVKTTIKNCVDNGDADE